MSTTTVNVILKGTRAHSGTIDSLGTAIGVGPGPYFALLRNMAASFASCLSPEGWGGSGHSPLRSGLTML